MTTEDGIYSERHVNASSDTVPNCVSRRNVATSPLPLATSPLPVVNGMIDARSNDHNRLVHFPQQQVNAINKHFIPSGGENNSNNMWSADSVSMELAGVSYQPSGGSSIVFMPSPYPTTILANNEHQMMPNGNSIRQVIVGDAPQQTPLEDVMGVYPNVPINDSIMLQHRLQSPIDAGLTTEINTVVNPPSESPSIYTIAYGSPVTTSSAAMFSIATTHVASTMNTYPVQNERNGKQTSPPLSNLQVSHSSSPGPSQPGVLLGPPSLHPLTQTPIPPPMVPTSMPIAPTSIPPPPFVHTGRFIFRNNSPAAQNRMPYQTAFAGQYQQPPYFLSSYYPNNIVNSAYPAHYYQHAMPNGTETMYHQYMNHMVHKGPPPQTIPPNYFVGIQMNRHPNMIYSQHVPQPQQHSVQPVRWNGPSATCYNCGDSSHTGAECPENTMESTTAAG